MDIDIMYIIYPVLSIGGLGVVFGAILGYASQIFKVEQDPRIDLVIEALPGANCGGCGFPGCSGLATAIVEGRAPVNTCPVGGAKTAAHIAEILGVVAEEKEREVAFVKCNGTCDVAKNNYDYVGISDCVMAAQLAEGGFKGCSYGCLGLGSCVAACAFDALKIENGVAVVNENRCVACGKCVAACPKHLIELVPVSKVHRVQCSSNDKGKDVKANCSVGCIGCMICKKNCPSDAIVFENNLAKIDYSKCTNCGICASKCPVKIITGHMPAAKEEAAV